MIKSNSLECQDLFAYYLLKNQKTGYFTNLSSYARTNMHYQDCVNILEKINI
jgi:hypothetical protein